MDLDIGLLKCSHLLRDFPNIPLISLLNRIEHLIPSLNQGYCPLIYRSHLSKNLALNLFRGSQNIKLTVILKHARASKKNITSFFQFDIYCRSELQRTDHSKAAVQGPSWRLRPSVQVDHHFRDRVHRHRQKETGVWLG